MRYTIFLIFCVCFPVHTQTLDLSYSVPIEWDYCETHKEECERIANFDDSILPEFDLTPPISKSQWTTFITLQILDMYTTYKGLKYDCVYETNPIFGERPSVMKMGVTKFVILYPVIVSERNHQTLSVQNMRDINALMSLVVANNMRVVRDSKRNCTKIR